MSGTAASAFALNPGAAVHIETIEGVAQLIVIDDFYADPDAVRALALGGVYDSSLSYYPGVHAQIEPDALQGLLAHIARVVNALSGLRTEGPMFVSDFSFVTTPAKRMLALQKHPHIDGLPLAGVAYLSPHSTIGTSYFRHLPTGLDMVRTPEDEQRYIAWVKEHGEATQPDTYAVESPQWQLLHTLEGRYNRLVLYPGNLFHSIAMSDVAADLTLDNARLTQRFFLQTLGAAA